MRKLMYQSNSRYYTEQGNINENKYFTHINGLLDQGWKVEETFIAFMLLKKPNEQQ